MRQKSRTERRYKGLFIGPNMCDGIYDTHKDPEYNHPLSYDEIIRIMNDTDNQIKVWQDMYDEMKAKYKRCQGVQKKEE